MSEVQAKVVKEPLNESATVAAQIAAEMVKQLAPILASNKLDVNGLAEALAKGIQEGKRDPIKEARQVEQRQRMRAMDAVNQKDRKQRESWCAFEHGFGTPYLGTTAIAWGTQSDGKERGVCQHCGKVFFPEMEEGRAFYEKHRTKARIGEGVIGR